MAETILRIVIFGLLTGGIYALISMGLNLQYGVARVLNIAHGEFIMLGALLTYTFYTGWGINPLLSLAISGPLLFALAFVIHGTLFKSLRTRAPSQGAFEGNSLLAAFGLLFVIQSIATLIWGAHTRAYTYLNVGVEFAGTTFTANRLIAFAVAIGASAAFYSFVTSSRPGKAIRAAAQDPATAGLMGVNINQVLALGFGLGAFLAGLAGLLISMYNALTTNMGLPYTVIALIVIVLGGLGSIPGSLIGGVVIGITGEIVATRWDPGLSVVVYYGIFLLLLLLRPAGILGKR
ncbi:MAG: branched-chain amino acid ABC transporter permease [Chloroflexi bacterium]|nr:branched-chain amino acid ABC transporter permease [Chloroflexota bacterium]